MNVVAIIGGGAAGLLACGFAAKKADKVYLIEPNKLLGKKLRITGKGRCNVTNATDISDFLKKIPTNPKFLYSSFSAFSNVDMMNLLKSLGVECKIERGDRVFPVSDNAHDVADALKKFALNGKNVEWIHEKAVKIQTADGKVTGVACEKSKIECQKIICCTGGMSYPLTGSTGDGYKFAESVGHTIVMPKPSLIPLIIKEDFCEQLMGLTLKNVKLLLYQKAKKPVYEEMGEMLFTHFGISGPLVLSASAHMKKDGYRIELDLKPALTIEVLDERIKRDFSENVNKHLQNGLQGLLPKAMLPVIIEEAGLSLHTPINIITKEQRLRIVTLLKHFPLTPIGTRPIEEAIITSGGVKVSEINPKTMESKLIEGLFFAGEIIDCDGFTGGFNLQIAWSTAYSASTSI